MAVNVTNTQFDPSCWHFLKHFLNSTSVVKKLKGRVPTPFGNEQSPNARRGSSSGAKIDGCSLFTKSMTPEWVKRCFSNCSWFHVGIVTTTVWRGNYAIIWFSCYIEVFPRVINDEKSVSLANLAIFQVESTKLKTSFQPQGIAEKAQRSLVTV